VKNITLPREFFITAMQISILWDEIKDIDLPDWRDMSENMQNIDVLFDNLNKMIGDKVKSIKSREEYIASGGKFNVMQDWLKLQSEEYEKLLGR
jgi:hypothetical protein